MPIRKWRVTTRLFLTLCSVAPLLTGCWDRLEIEQRATVLGIAIDNAETTGSNGGETQNNAPNSDSDGQETDATGSSKVSFPQQAPLQLTAQLAVPGRIPLGPGESGGGSSPKSSVWVLRAQGETLDDALQQLQQEVADKLFLGHLRVVVVSEAFATKNGLEDITDVLRRNSEVRRTAWLMVAKGKASDVMKTSPPLERVPTLYLMSTMEHAKQMGKLPNIFLGVFESRSVMQGREPVLPYVEVRQKANINVNGLALFKKYKMVGTTTSPIQIVSYMELDGVRTGGYTLMVNVPGKPGAVMWHAYRRKRKVSVTIQNGRPHFLVSVHVDGIISSKSGESFRLDDPKVISAIQEEVVRRAKLQLDKFVSQTQKYDADVIGFGEYVRARKRRYWDTVVKTSAKWEQIYPTVQVDAKISVRTHRIGMKGT